MIVFVGILCVLLVLCAISVALTKNLLATTLVYMSFSLIMCILWLVLESPDLAITEAAVGAGVTTLLFFSAFKKIRLLDEEGDSHEN